MDNVNVPVVETHITHNETNVQPVLATEINMESSDTGSETSSVTTVIPKDVEMTNKLMLRFSRTCRPFKLPSYPMIAFEASNHFEDPLCNVVPGREGSEKTYRIELTKYVPKHGNYLTFVVEGVKYNVDLEPFVDYREGGNRGRRGDRRENNLLLTFQGAGQMDFDSVPMTYFDDIIQKDLDLVLERLTEKQKVYGTQVFNGNRFCVVRRPKELAKIPEFIPVPHPTMGTQKIYIRYSGRLYNCGRCNKQHTGRCPELQEFYQAKEERERMEKEKEIETKIISDSTLRNADQLGLRADIMTMSGGGLGQIVQAARDDPDTQDKTSLIILGGTNDVKNASYENEAEFAENVNNTVTKITEFASGEPNKKFVYINSHPRYMEVDAKTPELSIIQKARETYLHKTLKDNIKRFPDLDIPIKNVEIIDVSYDIDDTGHPTIDGTREILEKINDCVEQEKKIIWNSKFITSEDKYKRVQSIFRYGCNHCDGFGQSIQYSRYKNGNVCDDCMDIVKHNTQTGVCNEMLDIYNDIKKNIKDPPPRSVPEDEEERPPKSKKPCLTTSNQHGDDKEQEKMATDD